MNRQEMNMSTETSELPETVTPTEADARLAAESSRRLAGLLDKHLDDLRIRIQADDEVEAPIAIPISAFRLLTNMLSEMAKGNAVTLMPVQAELTTQQAADFLNVSRPFLIDRLENGEIPFHKVGTHRRVRFEDLQRYKRQIDAKRLQALEELSAVDQELGLGYQK